MKTQKKKVKFFIATQRNVLLSKESLPISRLCIDIISNGFFLPVFHALKKNCFEIKKQQVPLLIDGLI